MHENMFCIETYVAPMPSAEGYNLKSIRTEAVKLVSKQLQLNSNNIFEKVAG